MAYDDKAHYPDRPKTIERESAARSIGGPQELGQRALNLLKACQEDMKWLDSERQKMTKLYNADKLGNEIKGRSQVVMSDVSDTIHTLLPYLMDMFYGGANVMNCTPIGPEDENPARLMEEKVNFDLQRGLNGFKLLHTFFMDALLHKMGVIKYYWLKENSYEPKHYKNMNDWEFKTLLMSGDYEIDSVKTRMTYEDGRYVELEDSPDMETFPGEDVTHEVKCRKICKKSQPYAENLPPEEFIFDYKARDIDEAFKCHKKRVHKNHLTSEYGLSKDEIQTTIDDFYENSEVQERYADLGGSLFISDERESQFLYLYECYIDDYDSKGRPLPKIVTVFGNKVLRTADNKNGAGFVVASPIIVSHRVCGKGLAETVMEIQKLHTALVRFVLDTVYFSTSGRVIANPHRIDLDSLLTSNRPGGVAVTKFDINPAEGVFPMPIATMPPYVMKMVEYVSMMRENRSGITRYVGGVDPQSLNRTATGVTAIMNAAQQRIRLIAQIFAETGVRELYQAFVDMNIRFMDTEQNVKINKEWQVITPDMIDGKFDVMIDIGANSGIKEQKFQQKMQMLQVYGMMAKMMPPQMSMQIFTVDNIKNMIRSMWEDLGHKNVDEFVAPEGSQGMLPMMQQMMGGDGGGGAINQQGGGGGEAAQKPTPEGLLQGLGNVPA